jgi:hypothetical protein
VAVVGIFFVFTSCLPLIPIISFGYYTLLRYFHLSPSVLLLLLLLFFGIRVVLGFHSCSILKHKMVSTNCLPYGSRKKSDEKYQKKKGFMRSLG